MFFSVVGPLRGGGLLKKALIFFCVLLSFVTISFALDSKWWKASTKHTVTDMSVTFWPPPPTRTAKNPSKCIFLQFRAFCIFFSFMIKIFSITNFDITNSSVSDNFCFFYSKFQNVALYVHIWERFSIFISWRGYNLRD